jgi:hypothetical protein
MEILMLSFCFRA